MDHLSFIEKLVASLAWPITIFLVAMVFRRPIAHLIERITGIKFKGLDVTLAEAESKLARAREDLPKPKTLVVPAASKDVPGVTLTLGSMKKEDPVLSPVDVTPVQDQPDLSSQTPKQIIKNAWRRVVDAVKERAKEELDPAPASFAVQLRELKFKGTIQDEVFQTIDDLQAVKKELLGIESPGRPIASSFWKTADRVVLILQDEVADTEKSIPPSSFAAKAGN